MLEKYKKMGLAAATCMLLGVNSSEAAVTLTFQQVGTNVTATWSGTYLSPANAPFTSVNFGTVSSFGLNSSNVSEIVGGGGAASLYSNAGTLESGLLTKAVVFGLYAGSVFGFGNSGQWLVLPQSTPASTLVSPNGVMTFLNQTLAGMEVANFNNTLVFTGTGSVDGSREIRLTTAAVPEPTSALLGSLAALALLRRRR